MNAHTPTSSSRARKQAMSAAERREHSKQGRLGLWFILPGFFFLLLFFAIPVVVMLATSLYQPAPGGGVGAFVPSFKVSNYTEALGDYWIPLLRSFGFALITTIAALLIGYPMAYLVAVRLRGKPLLQGLLMVLIIAPFFASFILRTQAWKIILSDDGMVVGFLKTVSILPPGAHLTATAFAVVCGMTYNFLPFMALPIYANLERLDTSLLEAGSDLYASPLTTFFKVTLPLSMPGVLAGTLLTFIPAAGDYVNSALLGNNRNTTMIGQIIESRFFQAVDYPHASALSAVLMVSILILVSIYVRRFGTKELV